MKFLIIEKLLIKLPVANKETVETILGFKIIRDVSVACMGECTSVHQHAKDVLVSEHARCIVKVSGLVIQRISPSGGGLFPWWWPRVQLPGHAASLANRFASCQLRF